jgi:hypothetical protein
MAIIGLTTFITATTTGDIGDIAKRQRSSHVTLRRMAVLRLAVAHRCDQPNRKEAGIGSGLGNLRPSSKRRRIEAPQLAFIISKTQGSVTIWA